MKIYRLSKEELLADYGRLTVDELKAKAAIPAQESLILHEFYTGKLAVSLKCCVRGMGDFARWYSPGVAAPCMEIFKDPARVYNHTNKGNMVMIATNGTRVLGLGNIGPEASLPVMEGKAILFKYLGGVDAFPLPIAETNPLEFIRVVERLQASFGGINLEDISQPECFKILTQLRSRCGIPVWHDDQQGTACVCLASLINALKVVGKDIKDVKIVLFGAGAANIRIGELYMEYGAKPGNIIYVDSKGALHPGRADIKAEKEKWAEKWAMCELTNKDRIVGKIAEALSDADVLSAASTPGPGTIDPKLIALMAKDPILLLTANPVPEMWPWEAIENGAAVVCTGRSDWPNQANNSMGFPGIFRGVLDVGATYITNKMCIAAAEALANRAVEKYGELRSNYVIPTMEDTEAFIRVAVAVGMKAIEQGKAQKILTSEELRKSAEMKIFAAHEEVRLLMEKNLIPAPPV